MALIKIDSFIYIIMDIMDIIDDISSFEWIQIGGLIIGLIFSLFFTERGFHLRLYCCSSCCKHSYWYFSEVEDENDENVKILTHKMLTTNNKGTIIIGNTFETLNSNNNTIINQLSGFKMGDEFERLLFFNDDLKIIRKIFSEHKLAKFFDKLYRENIYHNYNNAKASLEMYNAIINSKSLKGYYDNIIVNYKREYENVLQFENSLSDENFGKHTYYNIGDNINTNRDVYQRYTNMNFYDFSTINIEEENEPVTINQNME